MKDDLKKFDTLGLFQYDFTEDEFVLWLTNLCHENSLQYFFNENEIIQIKKIIRKIKIRKIEND